MIGNQKLCLAVTVLAAFAQVGCAPTGPCEKGEKELCEGVENRCDNNSDGVIDEGCPGGGARIVCNDGESRACIIPGSVGACSTSPGNQKCDRGLWSDCQGARRPNEVREFCGNNVDDDCNSLVDEVCECEPGAQKNCGTDVGECSFGQQTCGDDHHWISACVGGQGTVEETCDGKDSDCDNVIDDNISSAPRHYRDTDGDGYGDPNTFVNACASPAGYVSAGNDCNDGSAAIHPGALELCDGVDNDCDRITDPPASPNALTFCLDRDGDGFTDGTAAACEKACTAPSTVHVQFTQGVTRTDCDDDDARVHPNATETCNGKDDNCDGFTDPAGSVGVRVFFPDADLDVHGVPAGAVVACAAPAGFAPVSDDCNDSATGGGIFPGAVEVCGDGIDNNCDPTDDDQGIKHYADTDGDGLGDPNVTRFLCASTAGFVLVAGDCDDTRAAVLDGTVYHRDADSDTFGSITATVKSCTQPSGYVLDGTDCRDDNSAIKPGATEVCNGLDDDCNGLTDPPGLASAPRWFLDGDRDTHGDPATSVRACTQPALHVAVGDDCDDGNAAVHPGATETCNGVDDDCDTVIDPPTSQGAPIWFRDVDADSFGTNATVTSACVRPIGYSQFSTDCEDGDAAINPSAVEVCGDAVDNNCNPADDLAGSLVYADVDGDGFGDPDVSRRVCAPTVGFVAIAGDCDDSVATGANVNPDADELCADTIDNNCDGAINEDTATDATTWHRDADGDLFGSITATVKSCAAPSGYVLDATDCRDDRSDVKPGATELCDGLDNDCDGLTDPDGLAGAPQYFFDGDRDGFGEVATSRRSCSQPANHVASNTDCNDQNAAVNPGIAETCNGVDDNCDSVTDPDTSAGAPRWYADTDLDGFGAGTVTIPACAKPVGFSAVDTDCDDAVAAVNPGAVEVCGDNVDNNCNSADDILGNYVFRDFDNDGFGDPNNFVRVCAPLAGYVAVARDCDDSRASVNPNVAEVCNGRDDNCDGATDDGASTDATTWHRDGDGDLFGSITDTVKACAQPVGYVLDGTDCRDDRSDVKPGATETCDGLDNDCDGLTDPDTASGSPIWYFDGDRDTFGNPVVTRASCSQPAFHVGNNADCNDGNATVSPSATEVCDGVDNNCDGVTDPVTSAGAPTWFRDVDLDNFGIPGTTTVACTRPAGYAAVSTDCNDGDGAINPGVQEICANGIDDNCNPADDLNGTVWYRDVDGDGYGNPNVSQQSCSQPVGYVTVAGDCNDTLASINPGAAEICDTVDNDCDGLVDESNPSASVWHRDADGDNFGAVAVTVQACTQPSGYVLDGTDCRDDRSDIRPGATEMCDGLDNDCDGVIDPVTSADALTWNFDGDRDNFGTSLTTTRSCTQPQFYVSNNTDCNDGNATVNPSATEVCDGADNDCDGVTDPVTSTGAPTWFRDADSDNFGIPGTTTVACTRPAGYAAVSTDCNDSNSAINPGVQEICANGVDDNCNPADDLAGTVWHRDVDGDGFGDPAVTQQSCSQPAGFVVDGTDCNDASAAVRPGATETCNGVDDNCDGQTDDATSNNALTFFRDADADGFGLASSSVKACAQPAGYVVNATDCNDQNNTINPSATEVCDGVDNDCDGVTDPNTSQGAPTWNFDGDRDGFGTPGTTMRACSQPQFFVGNSTDCNDGNAAVSPSATEVCDGLDNNCDGVVDPSTSQGAPLWFQDLDNDLFGTSNQVVTACTRPVGFAALATDCNDGNASINPGAAEICGDGIDQDCIAGNDGVGTVWHRDADVDSFGNLNQTQQSCAQPAGFIVDATDCNDANASIFPGAVEVCGNGLDDNCNGNADENCGGSSSSSGSSSSGSASSSASASSSSMASSSSGGSSSGGMVQGGAVTIACFNAQGGPGCTGSVCDNTVEVFVSGASFPSTQWLNGGGAAGLTCENGGGISLRYEAGCSGSVFCEDPSDCVNGDKYTFWVTPGNNFTVTVLDQNGVSHDLDLNQVVIDPSPTYLGFPAVERCSFSGGFLRLN